jgi:hypothetical protein
MWNSIIRIDTYGKYYRGMAYSMFCASQMIPAFLPVTLTLDVRSCEWSQKPAISYLPVREGGLEMPPLNSDPASASNL